MRLFFGSMRVGEMGSAGAGWLAVVGRVESDYIRERFGRYEFG